MKELWLEDGNTIYNTDDDAYILYSFFEFLSHVFFFFFFEGVLLLCLIFLFLYHARHSVPFWKSPHPSSRQPVHGSGSGVPLLRAWQLLSGRVRVKLPLNIYRVYRGRAVVTQPIIMIITITFNLS